MDLRFFRRKKDSQILYTEALEALLQGDSDNAFEKLRELIREDTENIRAYLKLGDIFRERGQVEQAIKIHRSLTFRRKMSTAMKVEIYASLALDYRELGRFDRAEESADRILKFERKNRWALDFLIEICEQHQRWEAASKNLHRLEKASRQNDHRRRAYYTLMQGRARDEDGLQKEARGFYQKAISQDDSYADPHLYMGNLEEEEGNIDGAVTHWKAFAERSSGAGKQVYGRLEKALFELGRFGEIEEFYRTLREQDGKNLDALAGLVNVLAAKGEYDHAIAMVDDIIGRNGQSVRIRLARLKLELRKRKEEELSGQVDEIVSILGGGR